MPEGREYPVLCRRWEPEKDEAANARRIHSEGGVGLAREEVVLDWNELAERNGKSFLRPYSHLMNIYVAWCPVFSIVQLIIPSVLTG